MPLCLHDWNVDFAVWCSYKYLNAGPGAVAGAFVHERHATNTKLPRFAGWFGNDPNTRFRLHLEPEFIPVASADGWQISNPPIFSMAPLRASLSIFDDAGGMEPLRVKSIRLTGYLEFLLTEIGSKKFTVITPRDPNERGCQLSILAHEHPKELLTGARSRWSKMRFPRTQRHPRRADPALQYVSRSLALREDSGSASIAGLWTSTLPTDSCVEARPRMGATPQSSIRPRRPDLPP